MCIAVMATCFSKTFAPEDDVTFIFNTLRHTCTEGTKTFLIFGGVPRDLIRGSTHRDIDVYIKESRNISHFCSFLRRADRLRKETRTYTGEHSQYTTLTLEVQTSSTLPCIVDVTSDTSVVSFDANIASCDFTCNNLVITRDGEIATRLDPPDALAISQPQWITRCLRDTIQGNLVWMVSESTTRYLGPKAYTAFHLKMKDRLKKMLTKGFTAPVTSLTTFECKGLTQYTPHPETACAICKEEYAEKPAMAVLVLKCGHHFHTDCIDSWMQSGRYHNTCPICREVIEFTYE